MRKGKEMSPAAASASSAYAWVLGLLDEVGSGPLRHPSRRQCPAHEDETPSLSVGCGEDGRALLHCHAGCSLDEILEALAMGRRHLFSPSPFTPAQHARICHLQLDYPPIKLGGRTRRRGGRNPAMKLEAIHSYGDYELLRYRRPGSGEKSLEWEHRGEEGVWLSGLGGARLEDLPLYMEDQVRMGAAAGEMIVVVESESSADAYAHVGVYATTWAGGAQAPQLERLAEVLTAAQVLVIPDHDPAGLACGREVVAALTAAGATVSSCLPPAPGEDARDLLVRCGPPPWPTSVRSTGSFAVSGRSGSDPPEPARVTRSGDQRIRKEEIPMTDIQVCAFHGDEGVFGEPVGDEAGSLRYTCTRKRGHPREGPYSWVHVPTPVGVDGVSGLAAELGLNDDLVEALEVFRGSWVEYGVVEREYARLNPETFASLVKKYGHTAVAAKRYTASAFIGRTLGELSKTGSVLWHAGPATGRWSYNANISWWALPPEPDWSTASSWARLDCDVRYVPGQTEI